MHDVLTILAASLALVVAAPAVADDGVEPPGRPVPVVKPLEIRNNVLRVNLGVGFYNSGWYDCHGHPYYSCDTGSYTSYVPLLVGPQVDVGLGGLDNLSVGLTVATGTVHFDYCSTPGLCAAASGSATLWEPTVDYVAKFGPPTEDTVGRFRVGAGAYLGPNSTLGGVLRMGGGASFLNARRLGFGLDFVLEGGVLNGYWIGGLQLVASPELHF